jgi:Ca2+/H+ antiporter, TMEM165/GDT1 family
VIDLHSLLSTFALIGLAELGDKSLLVCLTLAARHRPGPVFAGAVVAFASLNLIAVSAGGTLGVLLPRQFVVAIAALLFVGFGAHALWTASDEEEKVTASSGSPFRQTVVLLFIAEFGDKTQLAVAGLASTSAPLGVWLGATAALVGTSALGIAAGRLLHTRISPRRLQQAGGVIFLLFGVWMGISVAFIG